MRDAIVKTNLGDLVRASPNLSQWTGRSLLSRRDFKNFIDSGRGAEELLKELTERYQQGWGATEHKTLDFELRGLRGEYDFIFLDTNPSLTLLTLNSLYTADYVLVPAYAEESSRKAVMELADTMGELQEQNPDMHAKILGILLTKYKRQTKIAAAYTSYFDKMAKKLGTIVFNTKIREGIVASEYANKKQDLIRYSPKSPVAQDYQEFVTEFLDRIKEVENA